jgi:hypothetical protein
MPRRRTVQLKSTIDRDIQARRRAIASGAPWQLPDQHFELVRHLSPEAQFILTELTPLKSVSKYIVWWVPEETVRAARQALASDITEAQKRFG